MTGVSDRFPSGHADERELYLDWLAFLRGAVLRKLHGLTDEQARWRPDESLICLLGVVNHLRARWRREPTCGGSCST